MAGLSLNVLGWLISVVSAPKTPLVRSALTAVVSSILARRANGPIALGQNEKLERKLRRFSPAPWLAAGRWGASQIFLSLIFSLCSERAMAHDVPPRYIMSFLSWVLEKGYVQDQSVK